jgi:hypothetical protein
MTVMKYLFGILFIMGCSLGCHGQYYKKMQNPDKNYLQHTKQITIDLSPIILSHGRYYYDGRHVRYEQLTMPLLAVKDSVVDHYMKSAMKTRLIGAVFQLGTGLTYTILLASKNPANNINLLLGFYLGQILLGQAIRQLTVSPQRKAVDRYNEIILQPSAFALPGYGVSLGVTAKF